MHSFTEPQMELLVLLLSGTIFTFSSPRRELGLQVNFLPHSEAACVKYISDINFIRIKYPKIPYSNASCLRMTQHL